MDWIKFPWFAVTAIVLWLLGLGIIYLSDKRKLWLITGICSVLLGVLVIAGFISILWVQLDRPPLRTLGETRLWYVFFLPLIGILFYLRWRYRWFLALSLFMTVIFLLINLSHPETYDQTLMPALQSPWFIPHVIVYIFGYAMLGVSMLVAVYGLYQHYSGNFKANIILMADNLVYFGFAFLTMGLLFGALWAKQAWGQYWTWDPKETWAFLTWLGYLIYIHLRHHHPAKTGLCLWVLSLAFIILIFAWFGLNYIPSAENSIHVYSDF